MQALVVYNKFSGKSKIVKQIDYICQRLKTKYEIVETFASTGPNSIREYEIGRASCRERVLAGV